MTTWTMRDLEPLYDQFTGEGQVLSCYAEVRASEGFRPDWKSPFESRADAIWKSLGEDGRARLEFEENRSIIKQILDGTATKANRWVAVFGAARRGFSASYPLDVPVETELVQHPTPYLVPLLAAIHRRRVYLAIQTDTHRGRIFAATPAAARLLEEIDESVPKKQHSAGQTWGTEQATIARHREDRILHYRKELVGRIEKEWARGEYSGIVLLGDHPTLTHLREALPRRLAAAVRREKAEAWTERSTPVEETVRKQALDLFTETEAEVAEGFWDLLAEGRSIAVGPQAVLDAIQNGRVGPDGFGYLVLGPDPREVIGRCRTCRYLSFELPKGCPRCGSECLEGNLWEELLQTALRHRISARLVSNPTKLARQGGVVAVLPRDRPAPSPGGLR